MKKLLFIAALFTSLSYSAQLKRLVDFGPIFSANSTNFDARPHFTSVDPQLGYQLAAFLRVKILMLYAEVDCGYSAQNIVTKQKVAGVDELDNYALNGLNLSGILGWKVIGIGRLGNFRVFGGYNLNNYSTVTITNINAAKSTSHLNNSNNGIVMGTGVDVWKFVFNVKYILGLADIDNTDAQKLKTNTTVVSVGFKL